MQLIILFIRKNKYFLLFILLQIIAFIFTIQSHSYHKSRFVNSANFITGGIYQKLSQVNEVFSLKSENLKLSDENARLKTIFFNTLNKSSEKSDLIIDTVFNQKYKFIAAKIINNNYQNRNNILTLNKGSKDGLISDMAVVNSLGIIGVVNNVSKNYATVLSILNDNSKINVRLKNDFHFGTLIWDGKNYNIAQLIDIPRQTVLKKGDTIITGGKSAIFPEGINVGTIKDFKIENNYYKSISITLFNDMSSLSNVHIIHNLEKSEQKQLEEN